MSQIFPSERVWISAKNCHVSPRSCIAFRYETLRYGLGPPYGLDCAVGIDVITVLFVASRNVCEVRQPFLDKLFSISQTWGDGAFLGRVYGRFGKQSKPDWCELCEAY